MPTTRSANRPAPKRAISPDSNDEEDEFTLKKTASARGRRGENKRGGSTRGRGGRGGTKVAADGKPPAKRGRKKKTNKSDSEDEQANQDSDHLHEELKKCHGILVELAKSKHEAYTFPFKKPVDTVALGLLDYHEVVKKPMDLLTMKKKLIGEEYDTAVEFKEDFKLIISNCLLYNNRGDPVSQLALQLRDSFAREWEKLFSEDDDDFGKADDNDEKDDDEGEEEVATEMKAVEEEDNGGETKKEEKKAAEGNNGDEDGLEQNKQESESLAREEDKSISGAVSPKSDDSDNSDSSNESSNASNIEGNRNMRVNDEDPVTTATLADSTTVEPTL